MIKNVFLSYAREDSAAVDEIRAGLEAAGHDVWLDTADVVGGEQWRAAIVEAIDDSDVVVVVLSHHSTVSGAVRTEVDIASEAQKQIVPITLDGEKPTGALRWNISGLQVIDMSSDRQDGIQALLAALDSARPLSPAPPTSKKTWYKWAALPIAVLVGLILVLLFAADDGTEGTTSTTAVSGTITTQDTTATTSGTIASVPTTVDTCLVTIENPFVPLNEEPDTFALSIMTVPKGDHVVIESAIVKFAGNDERWLKITIEGRQGWIRDDIFNVSAKSSACSF